MYPTPQRLQIVKWYFSGSSIRDVINLFALNYKGQSVPSKQLVCNIIKKFETDGCLLNCRCHKAPKEISEEHRLRSEEVKMRESIVCALAQQDEALSSKQIAKKVGVHIRTVWNILKRHSITKKAGVHKRTVLNILKKRSIATRSKTSVNKCSDQVDT